MSEQWSTVHCTLLYCTTLYSTVQYCTVLYSTLHCTTLYSTVVYCTVVYIYIYIFFFFPEELKYCLHVAVDASRVPCLSHNSVLKRVQQRTLAVSCNRFSHHLKGGPLSEVQKLHFYTRNSHFCLLRISAFQLLVSGSFTVQCNA